jgi:hypothetical protein
MDCIAGTKIRFFEEWLKGGILRFSKYEGKGLTVANDVEYFMVYPMFYVSSYCSSSLIAAGVTTFFLKKETKNQERGNASAPRPYPRPAPLFYLGQRFLL